LGVEHRNSPPAACPYCVECRSGRFVELGHILFALRRPIRPIRRVNLDCPIHYCPAPTLITVRLPRSLPSATTINAALLRQLWKASRGKIDLFHFCHTSLNSSLVASILLFLSSRWNSSLRVTIVVYCPWIYFIHTRQEATRQQNDGCRESCPNDEP
jgi:hypothetical protein